MAFSFDHFLNGEGDGMGRGQEMGQKRGELFKMLFALPSSLCGIIPLWAVKAPLMYVMMKGRNAC